MIFGNCPECEFELQREKFIEGELIDCSDCGTRLEVVNVGSESANFEVAPETQEDWGE